MTAAIIENVVRDMIAAWESPPEVINSGLCHCFAIELRERMWDDHRVDVELLHSDSLAPAEEIPGHAFCGFEGRYYDAESLAGVSEWRALPIFSRFAAACDEDALLKFMVFGGSLAPEN